MLCIINIIHVYTCILARVQCIYMTEAPRVLHFSAFIVYCTCITIILLVIFQSPKTVTLTSAEDTRSKTASVPTPSGNNSFSVTHLYNI